MDKDFEVKVGQFKGSLDLLLDLIEKRKLHISDVSLSQVADEFIEYTKSFENFPIGDSADFILVASTLLLIKSKSLLPNMALTEEEQGSIEDLERRLSDYKKYKELAAALGKIFGNFLYFANERPARLPSPAGSVNGGQARFVNVIFSPTPEINLNSLKNALGEALKNIPQKFVDLPKVAVGKIISLEEMIEKLSERVEKSLRGSFRDFSEMGKADKVNVIVSFLAMLELVKRGAVRVNQSRHFDDISIESEKTGVPTYY